MRGAIIGFGVIASQGHVPALLKLGLHEILAVVDPVPARRQAAQAMIPGVKTFASHHDLLSADLALDFVDIATPPCYHLEIALAAAQHGHHVLVEKPITTSLDQARALLRAARDHQVTIFPCHNYKQAPVVREMRRIVDAGQIGQIRTVTLTTFRTQHAKGTPDWQPDWRRDAKISGGGISMDHGSHTCYLTAMFFGGTAPRSVSARIFQLDPGHDTEDNLCCTLTFAQGFAQVHLSWTAGMRKMLTCLQGSEGAVVVDDDAVQICTRGEHQRQTISSRFDDPSHTEWFTSMFDQFTVEVADSHHVTSELIEAYWCIATIEAIYRSAALGGAEVFVDVDLNGLVS